MVEAKLGVKYVAVVAPLIAVPLVATVYQRYEPPAGAPAAVKLTWVLVHPALPVVVGVTFGETVTEPVAVPVQVPELTPVKA